jgi:adenine-specific DNA-methyltransferase
MGNDWNFFVDSFARTIFNDMPGYEENNDAKYDNPIIKGVGGLRDYQNQKSKFCNATSAIQELSKVAKEGKFKTLILSYNTEGIMKQENIISSLEKFGKVELVEFEYLRFKSNSNGESSTKKFIQEQLYILNKYA